MAWLQLTEAAVQLGRRDIGPGGAGEIARELAYLPHATSSRFRLRSRRSACSARYAQPRGIGIASDDDLAAARAAMIACDVTHLAARRLDELSGGEARRVIMAQAPCQGARCKHLQPTTLVLASVMMSMVCSSASGPEPARAAVGPRMSTRARRGQLRECR